MLNLSELIDTAILEEKSIDLSDFIDSYRHSESFKKALSNYNTFNNFDSNIWIFSNELLQSTNSINFNNFNNLIKSNIATLNDLELIKCFLVETLDSGITPLTVKRMFNSIQSFIKASNNFNFKDEEDIGIILSSGTDTNLVSSHIVEYIEFLSSISYSNSAHIIAMNYFYEYPVGVNNYAKRELPKNSDIFTFDYYLKKLYKENDSDLLKKLYMPVLLWWKITTVIPLRPSEFSFKLKRNCIFEEDGKYYLKIDRVKIKSKENNRKNKRTDASIPLLSKIGITKNIFLLIKEYLDLITPLDETGKTLLSYKAYRVFLEKYYKTYKPNNIYSRKLIDNQVLKRDVEHFNREILQSLINSFYTEVIKLKYNDNSITKTLNVGDTRHLAFSSLLLQGVSPLEIAMLGGHTTLSSQNHYTTNSSFYIDSEILDYVSNRNIKPEIDFITLKKIILSKPRNPGKNLLEYIPTDDNIGYCTADYTKDVCDNNYRTCILCSKWWCYPSSSNYQKALKYIEKNSIGTLTEKLYKEEEFLKNLLKKANVVNIDGLIELDKSCDENIRKQVNQIKSTADEIIFMQKKLLELTETKLL